MYNELAVPCNKTKTTTAFFANHINKQVCTDYGMTMKACGNNSSNGSICISMYKFSTNANWSKVIIIILIFLKTSILLLLLNSNSKTNEQMNFSVKSKRRRNGYWLLL